MTMVTGFPQRAVLLMFAWAVPWRLLWSVHTHQIMVAGMSPNLWVWRGMSLWIGKVSSSGLTQGPGLTLGPIAVVLLTGTMALMLLMKLKILLAPTLVVTMQ